MSENSNNGGKVAGIIVAVVLVIAAAAGSWYFFIYIPEQEAKEEARLEQIKQEEAERKRQEDLAKKKARYEDLIEKADVAYDNENWQEAQSLYSEASNLLPSQQYAKDRLTAVDVKLEELAELEAKRQAGFVEKITERTGRFYIIVSSSIDDDLAMDYARKLASEGNNVKLIEHDAEKNRYYRVSVGDYETREEAESQIASFGTLDGDRWVLAF